MRRKISSGSALQFPKQQAVQTEEDPGAEDNKQPPHSQHHFVLYNDKSQTLSVFGVRFHCTYATICFENESIPMCSPSIISYCKVNSISVSSPVRSHCRGAGHHEMAPLKVTNQMSHVRCKVSFTLTSLLLLIQRLPWLLWLL